MTNSIIKATATNINNCDHCAKANVCKYQNEVIIEVMKLTEEVKSKELPLSININCNEFLTNFNSKREPICYS